MRFLGSLFFLVGALSVGAYAYFPLSHPHDGRFAEIVLIQATPAQDAKASAPSEVVTSDQQDTSQDSVFRRLGRAMGLVSPGSQAPSGEQAQPSASGATAGATQPSPAPADAAQPWKAVVSGSSGSGHATVRQVTPSKGDYDARAKLVRNLQTELKRVGCYVGEVDGDWGAASKRAITEFLHKVNATLPTDTPDYILLTLIQGHVDRACGVECPSGQGLAADGRCVANVVAGHGTKQTGSSSRNVVSVTESRDKLAAHATPPRAAAVPASNSTIAAAHRPEQGLSVTKAGSSGQGTTGDTAAAAAADTADAAASQEVVARRVEPLPGRMAVGAPIPADVDAVGELLRTTPSRPAAAAAPTAAPAAQKAPRVANIHSEAGPPVLTPQTAVVPPSGLPASGPHVRKQLHKPRAERRMNKSAAPSRSYASDRRASPRVESWSARLDPGTVRTTVGRVRRGSPQHNLMLSLGGVL